MEFTVAISKNRTPFAQNYWLWVCVAVFLAVWANSFFYTTDMANWRLENILVFMALPVIIISYRYYQFSDFSYILICAFLCLHIYGSKHTYAENPFGFWLMEQFGSNRNHYDRIVHFSYGFLLAYPMRELFLKWIKFPAWVAWVLPIEITLSSSGLYELIEWGVADIFFSEHSTTFLGAQGDPWDAQKDMFLATLGAILATTLVSIIKRAFNIYEEGDKPS